MSTGARERRLFRIQLGVPAEAAALFAAALDPFSDSVSWTEPEGEGLSRLTGFGAEPPDRGALGAALALADAAAGTPAPEVEIEQLPLRDWVLDNLKEFAPLIHGRFHIHGADFAGPVPPSLIGLRIPAAAAFGSGQHGLIII